MAENCPDFFTPVFLAMKKKLNVLLLALLAFPAAAIARPVSPLQAQKQAEAIFSRWHHGPVAVTLTATTTPMAKSRITASALEQPAFYVYGAPQAGGFVILSGDDRFPAVVGYSPEGTMTSADDIPTALQLLLNDYEAYVCDVRAGRADAPSSIARKAGETTGTPVVGPLVTCAWGQASPFNLLTPLEGREHTLTGCAATAMAQILYSWKWPVQGKGYQAYSTKYGTLDSDFSSHIYDWESMTDHPSANSSPEEKAAVSQLCYDCGVAIKMDFGTAGSSAGDDATQLAYYTYFGYRASTLKIIYRDCMNNQQEWNACIKAELDKQRPIEMSGHTSTGAGHAFIFDGYDSNGYVHVNWGWTGTRDGYYSLSLLNPPGYVFNSSLSAMIGIEPDREGTDTKRPQIPMRMKSPLRGTWKQRKVTQNFGVVVDTVHNNRSFGRNIAVGVGLYDLDDNLIDEISKNHGKDTEFYIAWQINYNFGSTMCQLEKEYEDGYYALRLLFREQGFDEWMLPDVEGGSLNNWIPIHIHDGIIDFNEAPVGVQRVETDAAEVSSITHFDLTGRRIDTPRKGQIYLQRTVLTDGSTQWRKILK